MNTCLYPSHSLIVWSSSSFKNKPILSFHNSQRHRNRALLSAKTMAVVAQISASLSVSIRDACAFSPAPTPSRLSLSNFAQTRSTFATGSPLVLRRTSCQRKCASRATPFAIKCEQSTQENGLDVWLGRFAMVGFAVAISVEIATGKGLLENFGLSNPLPTVALAVTALVGVLTAVFIFQSASKNFNFSSFCEMGGRISRLTKKLFPKNQMRIVMVGLDASGKTTILYKLKLGDVVTTIPTIGFNVETIQYKNINFTVWDVGGQDKIRPLWKHYFQNTQGLIFVVDSNDQERISEARHELHRILTEHELSNATLLVYANKKDLPNAMPVSEITDKLSLHSLSHRRWLVQYTSATSGEGLYEGLDWLANNISNKADNISKKAV
ncbi:uncharacterized protein LOC133795750 [Humulus lupulus]|uniref:uncharacterized protein LOC133795750 n=1 Tax=Humulus lupulus TaxID=3486 RepID=UPI002B40237F|nr:uncharacterized protein LOC133795750 [Humulus lupulus]